jgi:hypothetical protein
MIWALSSNPNISLMHNVAYGEGILTLTAGEATEAAASAGEVPALSAAEKDGLIFIWEVETGARELYIYLYDTNNLTIFLNLMRSEQLLRKHYPACTSILPGNQ